MSKVLLSTQSNYSQISNSPLNTSKSKQLYSFPKDSRFKTWTGNNSNNAFYDLPSAKNKRSAGIGYGTKFDFTKVAKNVPAPNSYSLAPEIDPTKKGGWSFGVSRENMYAQATGAKNKMGPGPGAYDVRSRSTNSAYSIRARCEMGKSKDNTPGPGNYPILPSLNEKGKYSLSKYKSSGCSLINPPSSLRFQNNSKMNVPGPGHYKPSESFGQYVLSTSKFIPGKTFPRMNRSGSDRGINSIVIELNFLAPGPGTYRLPSEFGYY